MAAIIDKRIDDVYTDEAPRLIGNGVPADTDALAVDTVKYNIGTEYFDNTGMRLYKRVAVSDPGVAADFLSALFA